MKNILKIIIEKIMRVFCRFRPTRYLLIKIIEFKKSILGQIKYQVTNNNLNLDHMKLLYELNRFGHTNPITFSKNLVSELIDYSSYAEFKALNSNNHYKINYDEPINPSNSIWYIHIPKNQSNIISQLSADKELFNLAREYIGSYPKIVDTRIWWSFPKIESGYVSNYGFHYDIDSPKFLNLFI